MTSLRLPGHRYYDPNTGRFLTRDPIGYAGGINLYAYCRNNPVNYVDPLGLLRFGIGVGGLATAGVGTHGGVTIWFDVETMSFAGVQANAGVGGGPGVGYSGGPGITLNPNGSGPLETKLLGSGQTGTFGGFAGVGGGASAFVSGPTNPDDLPGSLFGEDSTITASYRVGPTWGGGFYGGSDLFNLTISPQDLNPFNHLQKYYDKLPNLRWKLQDPLHPESASSR